MGKLSGYETEWRASNISFYSVFVVFTGEFLGKLFMYEFFITKLVLLSNFYYYKYSMLIIITL